MGGTLLMQSMLLIMYVNYHTLDVPLSFVLRSGCFIFLVCACLFPNPFNHHPFSLPPVSTTPFESILFRLLGIFPLSSRLGWSHPQGLNDFVSYHIFISNMYDVQLYMYITYCFTLSYSFDSASFLRIISLFIYSVLKS